MADDDGADESPDLSAAMDWVDEAVQRLQSELECVQGHWADLMAAGMEAESLDMAAHVYAMIQHCTALSEHYAATGKVLFDWIAPDIVKEQVVLEGIQRLTGNPYTVVGHMAGGILLSPDEIIVPDDIGGLDE